jgi:hypothetical protein
MRIPDPPKDFEFQLSKYYTSLALNHYWEVQDVTVDGDRALYTIRLKEKEDDDDWLYSLTDGEGIMPLVWNPEKEDWESDGFEWTKQDYTIQYDLMEITWGTFMPNEDRIAVTLSNVTSEGCTATWETSDDSTLINGSMSGTAECVFVPMVTDGKVRTDRFYIEGIELVTRKMVGMLGHTEDYTYYFKNDKHWLELETIKDGDDSEGDIMLRDFS